MFNSKEETKMVHVIKINSELVLRMRLVMIRLLVLEGMGGDLENVGIRKIIIWITLR